jgi:hypothetical protein
LLVTSTPEDTILKTQLVLAGGVVLALACSTQEADAAPRFQWTPLERPTTILPSRAEVMAIPTPERGRVAAFPVDVVRYGLTIHPGARIVRSVIRR